jgi:hypothetical protein
MTIGGGGVEEVEWEGSPVIWLKNDWSAFPLVGDFVTGSFPF